MEACDRYTLRRLAAKCANNHVIERRSKALQPQQLGVGVAGGAEAAVHAVRRLVSSLPDDNVVVKLDFSNAFNRIKRDLILEAIAARSPAIYCLVHSAYYVGGMFINTLAYTDDIVLLAPSWYGLQQLLDIVMQQSGVINMSLNARKSVCMFFLRAIGLKW